MTTQGMIRESHVNQKRCIEWGITLKEGYLLDFLVKLSAYESAANNYMPISRSEIVSRLPMAFNRTDSVYRKLKALNKQGLIQYSPMGLGDEVLVSSAVSNAWLEILSHSQLGGTMQMFAGDMQVSAQAHSEPESNRAPKQPIPSRIKKAVFERDKYRCQVCDTHLELSVDHIHPESKGGTLAMDNLQTLCLSCNRSKGAKTMQEWLGGSNESA